MRAPIVWFTATAVATYDLVVIGGGTAGLVSAWIATSGGRDEA